MTTPSTIEPGAVMPETGLSREAVLALSERTGEPQWLRASGVFTRREGDWRILQLHLSRAEVPAPADSAGAVARDTAMADSAAR